MKDILDRWKLGFEDVKFKIMGRVQKGASNNPGPARNIKRRNTGKQVKQVLGRKGEEAKHRARRLASKIRPKNK